MPILCLLPSTQVCDNSAAIYPEHLSGRAVSNKRL